MELSKEAIECIEKGNKIAAIKTVRGDLGLDLKDAKELVDNYCADHPELSSSSGSFLSGVSSSRSDERRGDSSGIILKLVGTLFILSFIAYFFIFKGN